ncbi:MAG: hypothetical protein LDL44_01640 [Caenispirillum sp.]|nr:hypothetical protein [Caenispirillum sp.]
MADKKNDTIPQTYCDGIDGISTIGGTVRIDLFAFSADKAKASGGKPGTEVVQRLVLSPEGFLQAFGAMESMVNELVRKGVIARKAG